jgi:hypothetical protein
MIMLRSRETMSHVRCISSGLVYYSLLSWSSVKRFLAQHVENHRRARCANDNPHIELLLPLTLNSTRSRNYHAQLRVDQSQNNSVHVSLLFSLNWIFDTYQRLFQFVLSKSSPCKSRLCLLSIQDITLRRCQSKY